MFAGVDLTRRSPSKPRDILKQLKQEIDTELQNDQNVLNKSVDYPPKEMNKNPAPPFRDRGPSEEIIIDLRNEQTEPLSSTRIPVPKPGASFQVYTDELDQEQQRLQFKIQNHAEKHFSKLGDVLPSVQKTKVFQDITKQEIQKQLKKQRTGYVDEKINEKKKYEVIGTIEWDFLKDNFLSMMQDVANIYENDKTLGFKETFTHGTQKKKDYATLAIVSDEINQIANDKLKIFYQLQKDFDIIFSKITKHLDDELDAVKSFAKILDQNPSFEQYRETSQSLYDLHSKAAVMLEMYSKGLADSIIHMSPLPSLPSEAELKNQAEIAKTVQRVIPTDINKKIAQFEIQKNLLLNSIQIEKKISDSSMSISDVEPTTTIKTNVFQNDTKLLLDNLSKLLTKRLSLLSNDEQIRSFLTSYLKITAQNTEKFMNDTKYFIANTLTELLDRINRMWKGFLSAEQKLNERRKYLIVTKHEIIQRLNESEDAKNVIEISTENLQSFFTRYLFFLQEPVCRTALGSSMIERNDTMRQIKKIAKWLLSTPQERVDYFQHLEKDKIALKELFRYAKQITSSASASDLPYNLDYFVNITSNIRAVFLMNRKLCQGSIALLFKTIVEPIRKFKFEGMDSTLFFKQPCYSLQFYNHTLEHIANSTSKNVYWDTVDKKNDTYFAFQALFSGDRKSYKSTDVNEWLNDYLESKVNLDKQPQDRQYNILDWANSPTDTFGNFVHAWKIQLAATINAAIIIGRAAHFSVHQFLQHFIVIDWLGLGGTKLQKAKLPDKQKQMLEKWHLEVASNYPRFSELLFQIPFRVARDVINSSKIMQHVKEMDFIIQQFASDSIVNAHNEFMFSIEADDWERYNLDKKIVQYIINFDEEAKADLGIESKTFEQIFSTYSGTIMKFLMTLQDSVQKFVTDLLRCWNEFTYKLEWALLSVCHYKNLKMSEVLMLSRPDTKLPPDNDTEDSNQKERKELLRDSAMFQVFNKRDVGWVTAFRRKETFLGFMLYNTTKLERFKELDTPPSHLIQTANRMFLNEQKKMIQVISDAINSLKSYGTIQENIALEEEVFTSYSDIISEVIETEQNTINEVSDAIPFPVEVFLNDELTTDFMSNRTNAYIEFEMYAKRDNLAKNRFFYVNAASIWNFIQYQPQLSVEKSTFWLPWSLTVIANNLKQFFKILKQTVTVNKLHKLYKESNLSILDYLTVACDSVKQSNSYAKAEVNNVPINWNDLDMDRLAINELQNWKTRILNESAMNNLPDVSPTVHRDRGQMFTAPQYFLTEAINVCRAFPSLENLEAILSSHTEVVFGTETNLIVSSSDYAPINKNVNGILYKTPQPPLISPTQKQATSTSTPVLSERRQVVKRLDFPVVEILPTDVVISKPEISPSSELSISEIPLTPKTSTQNELGSIVSPLRTARFILPQIDIIEGTENEEDARLLQTPLQSTKFNLQRPSSDFIVNPEQTSITPQPTPLKRLSFPESSPIVLRTEELKNTEQVLEFGIQLFTNVAKELVISEDVLMTDADK